MNLVLGVLLSCWLASSAVPFPDRSADEGEKAEAVVRVALEHLERLSIRRGEVDWEALRTEALAKVQGSPDLDTARAAVRELLVKIGDGHSRWLDPDAAKELKESRQAAQGAKRALPPPLSPTGRAIEVGERRLGYLRVPYLISTNPEKCEAFASRLDALQREVSGPGVTGWIIDVRRNVGGNMWPMLAGLSSIIGSGEAGSITQPTGMRMTWGTAKGTVWVGSPGNPVGKVTDSQAPDAARLPVAVLMDQRTASSGEAIVVSFKGRPETRFFGASTSGQSSANQMVDLPDGSLLAITTSAFSDRNGTTYGGPIAPDVSFDLPRPERDDPFPGAEGAADPVLDAAVEWLSGDRKDESDR